MKRKENSAMSLERMEGKMKMMKTCFVMILAVALMFVGSAFGETVATFADPSGNANDPLFNVNWTTQVITGGWADGKGGLLLQVPLMDASYKDTWFQMDQLAITSVQEFFGQKFGQTGAGHIRFYAPGTTTNPLLQIDFLSGVMGRQFLSAEELDVSNVTITGSAIPYALSFEQFSFSFANVTNFLNPTGFASVPNDGFTSTASFTSSAVVPEPATLALLGIGGAALLRRRSR
jgi:hypothetical protein